MANKKLIAGIIQTVEKSGISSIQNRICMENQVALKIRCRIYIDFFMKIEKITDIPTVRKFTVMNFQ